VTSPFQPLLSLSRLGEWTCQISGKSFRSYRPARQWSISLQHVMHTQFNLEPRKRYLILPHLQALFDSDSANLEAAAMAALEQE
jgi:phenylalanine-4-hydroxylase